MTDATPAAVPATATIDQLASALRTFLVALGAYGAGKGWFDLGLYSAAIPLIMIGVPFVWGQVKALNNHQTISALAAAATPMKGVGQ